MRNPRSRKGLVGGLLIIAIGIIFLLDERGIVSAGHVFHIFWPVFFIILGLEDLLAGYNPRKRTWGAFLIVGGTVLLLNQLGYFHIQIALFWPLLLIAAGLWVLLHNYGFLGGHPWHHQAWHFGHRGPSGPGGTFGPREPLGPSGLPGSEGPDPQTPPASGGPGAANWQPPYPNTPGFVGGAAPQDPREWLRQHRREFRR